MNVKAVLAVFSSAVAALLFAGCQSVPPGVETGPNGTIAYDVTIEASPPGAQIEANGQVIGNAPIHLKIYGDTDGTFHDFGSYYYVIRALPLTTNQFVQTRVFQTGHLLSPEDKIPDRIVFDMNRPEPPPVQGAPVYGYPAYGPPVYYYPPAYYGPRVHFYFGGPAYYHHHHW